MNLATNEAAALLHVSPKTVRKWVRLGKLPSTRIVEAGPHNCGKILIPRDACERLLDARYKPAWEKTAPIPVEPAYRFMGKNIH